jgi:hypothetical protein
MLDGVVRNDAAWANVQPMTGFTQVQPVEGASASQRTEVFLGFTDDTLYVGVVCYDDEPGSIIVSNSRRDSDLDQEDSFRLVIDSFRSEQDGFVFGTNPASLQYDGQLDNTGSNRFRSNGFNTNWDTTWDVVSTIGEHGWSAEFAIPFKSLRYGPQARQTWNVNFQRNIRRNNEVVYWAPLPLQYSLNRLSLAGSVEGIDVPAQRNLKFTPYMLAKIEEGGALAESQDDSEVGFDIKYSITPSLTMDVTYNTDFAQVEADQQQVNLDRFSLFFPEKRPFFLENASLFEVGVPRQLALFFSRNIGIGPNGEKYRSMRGPVCQAKSVVRRMSAFCICSRKESMVSRSRPTLASRASTTSWRIGRSSVDSSSTGMMRTATIKPTRSTANGVSVKIRPFPAFWPRPRHKVSPMTISPCASRARTMASFGRTTQVTWRLAPASTPKLDF